MKLPIILLLFSVSPACNRRQQETVSPRKPDFGRTDTVIEVVTPMVTTTTRIDTGRFMRIRVNRKQEVYFSSTFNTGKKVAAPLAQNLRALVAETRKQWPRIPEDSIAVFLESDKQTGYKTVQQIVDVLREFRFYLFKLITTNNP